MPLKYKWQKGARSIYDVYTFSSWSGIHLNVAKCKIAAYIHALQTITRKRDRDDAL